MYHIHRKDLSAVAGIQWVWWSLGPHVLASICSIISSFAIPKIKSLIRCTQHGANFNDVQKKLSFDDHPSGEAGGQADECGVVPDIYKHAYIYSAGRSLCQSNAAVSHPNGRQGPCLPVTAAASG